MLTKKYKPYIILGLIILWIIVTAHAASATNLDPAEDLKQLLGDPLVYVRTVEVKAFDAMSQAITMMVTIMGLVFMIRAIFPK